MKKTIALLLASVLVIALCACGGGSSDSSAAEAPAQEVPVAEAPAAAAPAVEAPAADDLAVYKEYVTAFTTAGAPDEDEAAAVAAAIDACASADEIEAIPQLTVLFENAGLLTYQAWLDAGKPEADVSGMSAGDPNAGSGEASGETTEEENASGEPSGEGGGNTTLPDAGYARDFEGYKQYVYDVFTGDPFTPADQLNTYGPAILEAADENDEAIQHVLSFDLVVTYEEFLAS